MRITKTAKPIKSTKAVPWPVGAAGVVAAASVVPAVSGDGLAGAAGEAAAAAGSLAVTSGALATAAVVAERLREWTGTVWSATDLTQA